MDGKTTANLLILSILKTKNEGCIQILGQNLVLTALLSGDCSRFMFMRLPWGWAYRNLNSGSGCFKNPGHCQGRFLEYAAGFFKC